MLHVARMAVDVSRTLTKEEAKKKRDRARRATGRGAAGNSPPGEEDGEEDGNGSQMGYEQDDTDLLVQRQVREITEKVRSM